MNGHCHSCVSDAIDIRRVILHPFFLVEKNKQNKTRQEIKKDKLQKEKTNRNTSFFCSLSLSVTLFLFRGSENQVPCVAHVHVCLSSLSFNYSRVSVDVGGLLGVGSSGDNPAEKN